MVAVRIKERANPVAGERVKARVKDEGRMGGQAFEVLNKESSLVTPGYPDRFPMMGVY